MYERFRSMSLLGQIITVMVVLFVAWLIIQFVVGIIKALIPIAILAVIIVGVLWLFDKVRD
jgi:hypothetical protein